MFVYYFAIVDEYNLLVEYSIPLKHRWTMYGYILLYQLAVFVQSCFTLRMSYCTLAIHWSILLSATIRGSSILAGYLATRDLNLSNRV